MKCLILLLAGGAFGWTQFCDPKPGAPDLAKSGVARQSSTYSINPSPVAMKAIDGIYKTNFHEHSCTHTKNDHNPWWNLDLQRSVKVDSVIITNRQDCCQSRLNGAQIKIGNSADGNNPVCGTINDVSNTRILVCCNGMEGRYLTVTIPHRQEYLTLCEVEVYEKTIEEEEGSCWESE